MIDTAVGDSVAPANGPGASAARPALSPDLLDGTAATATLLSSLLLEPPSAEVLERLAASADLPWPFPASDGSRPLGARLLCAPTDVAEAADDHLRLFGGALPALASPHESVYRSDEHLLFGEVTIEVRAAYARYGVAAPAGGRPADDHIGLELAFVAHHALAALDAIEAGDEAAAEQISDDLRAFCADHLLTWVRPFAQHVVREASTDLYRGVGHLLVDEADRWSALT